MENSFYIKAIGDKQIYHRIFFDQVVMCDVWANGVRIHLHDKPYLWVEATVETLFDLFFRKNKSFIRASANFIVNTDYVLTAEFKPDGGVRLCLADKKEAVLRTGHEFAYFIQNNKRKDEGIENTPEKDAIISSTPDVNMAIVKIYEATGESVTRRYVVQRFKYLSI